MAYSLGAHTSAGSSDGSNVTTSSIDTTGADFLCLAYCGYALSADSTISDNKSNTWTKLTRRNGGTLANIQMAYCQAPTVGSGHTFTASQNSTFPSIAVVAFSNSVATPADGESGTGATLQTTVQPGSLTPTQDNDVLITFLTWINGSNTASISGGGFSSVLDQTNLSGGQHLGIASAYVIQTTATASNPTWAFSTDTVGVAMAAFKDGAGGGASITYPELERQVRGVNRGFGTGVYHLPFRA